MPARKHPRLMCLDNCRMCGQPTLFSYLQYRRRQLYGRGLYCDSCMKQLDKLTHKSWYHERGGKEKKLDYDRGRYNRNPRSMKLNGCRLVEVKEGRCADYFTCDHADDCYTRLAKADWSGWTTEG